jgi:alpha-galactosidase
MIKVLDNKIFELSTKKTTYSFFVNEINYLEHLYYGKRIEVTKEAFEALKAKQEFPIGNSISYDEDHQAMTLETKLLEYSTRGKGDIRNPLLEIEYSNGNRTTDLKYQGYSLKEHVEMKSLPCSRASNDKVEDLFITLLDNENLVEVTLVFSIFEEEDVITRRMEIKNLGENDIKILRAFSLQLDINNEEYVFTSFHGGWTKEMKRYDQPCIIGTMVSESLVGLSSSRSNPFVMLSKKGCTEENGEVYGFNLIYSGNHQESVEVDSLNHLRFLTGINPTTFNFTLKKGEEFFTPEAIMTYSSLGYNEMSHQLHSFINKHIVRSEFAFTPRPVLINSWEAAYFKFNERLLLKMAKKAKKTGIELFVLDDGWFGKRNEDNCSLGDWKENKKKLPDGLIGLSNKIHKIGLKFGIWVEPEGVSEDSSLYRNHPEWVLKLKDHHHSLGRHQMILDFTNDEVVNYITDSMRYVFSQGIDYVKWDMNRIFTDYFSQTLDKEKMNELSYRYYLGLYKVLDTLTREFPHILMENCASGGNRFDLGMCCYFPQTWASDNTDAVTRMGMQRNYSYGYPLNLLGCHVASHHNHQTLRFTTLDTRFNVALFGQLGYELNICDCSKKEIKEISEQVALYKKEREYFINAKVYRSSFDTNNVSLSVVSQNQKHALSVIMQYKIEPGKYEDVVKFYGLDDKKEYNVFSKGYDHSLIRFGTLANTMSPIHIKEDGFLIKLLSKFISMKEKGLDYSVRGEILNSRGVLLRPSYIGTGYNDQSKLFGDFDTRLILVDEK